MANTWEGDLSGHETEPDDTMEGIEGDCHVNTARPAARRLTAASRFTNQVCWLGELPN